MWCEKACVDNIPLTPNEVDNENITQENVNEQESDNAFTALKSWRAKNKDRLTIDTLNGAVQKLRNGQRGGGGRRFCYI